MTDRPAPAEAARALQDAGARRDQAFDSATDAPWVYAVFGAALFLLMAAPDFLGDGADAWTSWALAALAIGYAAMLRTRRGSTLLGRPNRLRREEISPKFTRYHRLGILAVVVLGLVLTFVAHGDLSVPYLRTILGAVLGGVCVFFGRRLQRSLLAAARSGAPGGTMTGHGKK
ncbi:hypothetical protein [Streptomyces sp. NRRL F-5126]|uniref:hypothetical protein n=1 Tax=Streptomyces sp. NRRL F-5126 TaxID=1463857 RepID=UPI0004C63442|nr:hypothetical protein [Streptomyces sp. NRRL F-5126]